MLTKIRENIYIGDKDTTVADLEKEGITVVEFVAPTLPLIKVVAKKGIQHFVVSLHKDQVNRPHLKDIACHIPKYMAQHGEKIAVISSTGLVRAAFVVARAVCEMENIGIYEVFEELQDKLEGFDVGKAYL